MIVDPSQALMIRNESGMDEAMENVDKWNLDELTEEQINGLDSLEELCALHETLNREIEAEIEAANKLSQASEKLQTAHAKEEQRYKQSLKEEQRLALHKQIHSTLSPEEEEEKKEAKRKTGLFERLKNWLQKIKETIFFAKQEQGVPLVLHREDEKEAPRMAAQEEEAVQNGVLNRQDQHIASTDLGEKLEEPAAKLSLKDDFLQEEIDDATSENTKLNRAFSEYHSKQQQVQHRLNEIKRLYEQSQKRCNLLQKKLQLVLTRIKIMEEQLKANERISESEGISEQEVAQQSTQAHQQEAVEESKEKNIRFLGSYI